jgi:single-strand DNA-binding protein
MNGIATAFQGRVGSEPELKFTPAAKALLSFSVAVTQNRGGGDGAETQWIKVAAWEQTAETLADALHKGDEVYIEGSLKLSEWSGQDGERHTGLNVNAWKVEVLGKIGKRSYPASRLAKREPIEVPL